jgi:UPF0716 protein FxsA
MRALAVLIALIALPIAEIWLAVWLASQFGWSVVLVAAAVFLGLGIAMVGVASRKWSAAIVRAQNDPGYLNTGFPSAAGDAGLVLTGGLLMILPGFITGTIGLLLVFWPTRALIRRIFGSRVDAAASARGYRRITVIEGETVVRDHPPAPAAGPTGTRPPAGDRPVIVGEIVSAPPPPPRMDDDAGDDERRP